MKLQHTIGVAVTAVSYVMGDFTYPLMLIIFLLIIDMVTGVLGNWGDLSSKKCERGIRKKIATMIMIGLANMIGSYLNFPLRDTVIAFYIFDETVSILENLKKCGVTVPKIFTDALETIDRGE